MSLPTLNYSEVRLFFFTQGKVEENVTREMNARYLLNPDSDKSVPVAGKGWSLQLKRAEFMINRVSLCI